MSKTVQPKSGVPNLYEYAEKQKKKQATVQPLPAVSNSALAAAQNATLDAQDASTVKQITPKLSLPAEGADNRTLAQRAMDTLAGAGKSYAGQFVGTAEAIANTEQAYRDAVPSSYERDRERAWTLPTAESTQRQAEALQELGSSLKQSGGEDIARAQQGLGTVGRLAVNAGVAAGQMGLDIGLGAVTGGGAMLPMIIRSFGGGVQEAREKGYNVKQQLALGVTNAATEYFTEKLFGGNPVYDADTGLVNKLVAKVSKNEKLLSALSSLPADIISEGLEEMIADVLEPVAEWAITGTRPEYELDQIIEDGVVGMILGGIGQAGAAVGNRARSLALPAAGNVAKSDTSVAQPLPPVGAQNNASPQTRGQGATQMQSEGNLTLPSVEGVTAREAGESGTAYTVRRDGNGNVYVEISEDILAGRPQSEWRSIVKNTIRKLFGDGIQLERGTVVSNNKGTGEFSSGKYTKMLERTDAEIYRDKMRMAAGSDGIVRNAENIRYEDSKHQRKDDIVGFNRGNINVSVKGNGYNGDVLTAVYKDGKESFFDINNLSRKIIESIPSERFTANGFTQTDGMLSDNSIPHAAQNVNTESIPKLHTADALPQSTRRFYHDAERWIVKSLGETLSVPVTSQGYLSEIARQLTEEYVRSGAISQDTADNLFDAAYANGLIVDSEYYDQYKDIKKRLRDTPVTISETDRSGIPDFSDWKRRNRSNVRVVKEGGTPVDVFYAQMTDLAPELFPAEIVNPTDQLERMAEVGRSIEKAKYTIDRYYGSEAAGFYEDAKATFDRAISDIYGEARQEGASDAPLEPSDLDNYWKMVEGQANPFADEQSTRPEELISSRTEKESKSLKQSAGDAWSYFKRKMLDSGEAVTRIGKAVNDRFLYPYYNMARASTNAATSMITEGAADVRGRRTGKSLNDVFAPVQAKGDAYYKAFQEYLLHMHNVDRMSRENQGAVDTATAAFEAVKREYPELGRFRDDQIANMARQENSPYYFEAKEYTEALNRLKRAESITNKPVFGYDVGAEESRAAADKLLRQHPEYADYAQDVYGYIDNLLRYRVDSGLITEDNYQHLKEIYPHYVPTYRQFERTASTKNRKSVKVGSTIGQATGGTEKIMPLHEAIAKQTMSVVREGSKNRFGQRLLNSDTRRAAKEHIQHVEEYDGGFSADTFDELQDSGDVFMKENTFVVRENGRQYELTVSPALFEAVKALSPDSVESNAFTRTVRRGNDLFKRLVTGDNPTFLVRNFMRDLQDAGLYSKDLSAFAQQYPQAIAEIKKNGDYWQLYKALGGTYSSIFDYEAGAVKSESKLRQQTLRRVEALNEAVEQAPRLAEFMATVKKNGGLEADMDTLMEAMYNAADVTVNFGRSGTLGKKLNANYIPFLNPGIQGFDKMVRTFTEAKGAKDWMRLAVKCALFGVAPRLINELIYKDDDEWDELKDRDKDAYYLFKIKDRLWLKLPKGRTLSVIGAGADRIGDAVRGEDVDAGDYADFILTQTAPANPLQENVLKAWFDADLLNADSAGRTWYGSDIESQRLQNYAPGERYDARTDEFSKWLGGKLDLSPKKINYLLDQYSGVVGDVVLPLLTPAAERDMFSAAFTIDSASSNRLSSDFYRTKDELTYTKNGPESTGADQVVYRWFNKQSSGVSEVNAAIREIEGDKSLSNKDKKELLNAQYKIRNAVERSALDTLDAYAEAAERAYAASRGDEDDRVDEAYREANREVFGAEYALQTYDKDVYGKAVDAFEAGVSFDVFYDFYFATKGLTADKDVIGKTVSGSLKDKKLVAIDAMPLTDGQKDALYFAAGYPESTLDDAPWHDKVAKLRLPEERMPTVTMPSLALPSVG